MRTDDMNSITSNTSMACMHSIANDGMTLRPTETGGRVMELFRDYADINLICVADDWNRPLGLIERQHYLSLMSSPYAYALYHKRPLTLMMDAQPLIVEANTPIPVFTHKVLSRDENSMHKGFIIVENGIYLGTATPFDLIRASYMHSTKMSKMLHEKTKILNDIFSEITTTTQSINQGAETLKHESDTLFVRNDMQNMNLVKSDDKIKILMESTEEKAEQIESSRVFIKNATQDIEASCGQINDTIEKFYEMSNISSDIGSVLEIMGDISFQIHILGVNASIEAAQAGDYGKGFSVVADEVRKLAAVTSNSLEKIKSLVNYSRTTIQNCVELMSTNSSSLTEITKKVDNISKLFNEFGIFAQTQKAEILDLYKLMSDVRDSTRTNTETVNKTNDICQILFSNVSDLTRLTAQI